MARISSWVALCAVLASLGVITATAYRAEAQESSGDSTPLRPVKLLSIERAAAEPTRRFFGRVVARRTVDLAFQVGGEIVVFDVLESARISKDAQLAQLDLEPFELALRSARLSREKADRDLERRERLRASNNATAASTEDAKTNRDLAIVAERQAARNLEKATLKAPFDLLIARRDVDAFTTIAAGQKVLRVHDMSELRVNIEVPEILFRQAQGPEFFNLYAALVGDDTRYPLRAVEFNAETSDIGQSFGITLAFTGAVDPRILPGATVTVFAEPKAQSGAVFVPQSALVIAPDDSISVMKFTPKENEAGVGRVVATSITVKTLDGSRIEVVKGLSPGDQIVAAGASMLKDGQSVRVFKGLD